MMMSSFMKKQPKCTYKEAVENCRLPTYCEYEHLLTAVKCHKRIQKQTGIDKATRLNKLSYVYGRSRAIELYYDDLLCVYDDDELDCTVRSAVGGYHSPCGLMSPTPCKITSTQLWCANILTASLSPNRQYELPVSLSEENYSYLMAIDGAVERTKLVYFYAYNDELDEGRFLLCPACADVHSQTMFHGNQMAHHCIRYTADEQEDVIEELGPSMWKKNKKEEKEFLQLVRAYNDIYRLSLMQCNAALEINRAAGNSPDWRR